MLDRENVFKETLVSIIAKSNQLTKYYQKYYYKNQKFNSIKSLHTQPSIQEKEHITLPNKKYSSYFEKDFNRIQNRAKQLIEVQSRDEKIIINKKPHLLLRNKTIDNIIDEKILIDKQRAQRQKNNSNKISTSRALELYSKIIKSKTICGKQPKIRKSFIKNQNFEVRRIEINKMPYKKQKIFKFNHILENSLLDRIDKNDVIKKRLQHKIAKESQKSFQINPWENFLELQS